MRAPVPPEFVVGLSDAHEQINARYGLSFTLGAWKKWQERYDEFPTPAGHVSGNPWWDLRELADWLTQTGRIDAMDIQRTIEGTTQ